VVVWCRLETSLGTRMGPAPPSASDMGAEKHVAVAFMPLSCDCHVSVVTQAPLAVFALLAR
jgi:hypothetical protein